MICRGIKAPESVLGRGAVAVAALGAGTPSGDARRGFLHHLSTLQQHCRGTTQLLENWHAHTHTTITTTPSCCTKVVHRAIQRLHTHMHTTNSCATQHQNTGSQKDDWARKNMRGLQRRAAQQGETIGLGIQKDQPLYSWAVWYDMHRDRLWSPGTEALVPWDRSLPQGCYSAN